MKAVVIGGGIAGVFTAYFLRGLGVDVVGIGGRAKYPLTSLVLTLSMPDPRDIELARESLKIYEGLAQLKPVTSVDILPSWADVSSLRRAGVKYRVAAEFEGLRLGRDEVAVLTEDYMVPVRRVVEGLRRELGFLDLWGRLKVDGRRAYAVVGDGAVKADVVILAAGFENSAIAAAAGIALPLKPYSCYAAAFLVPPGLRNLSVGDYVLGWYGRPGPWPLYLAGDGCGRPRSHPPPGYAAAIAKLIARRAGWAIPLFSRSGECEGSPTGGPVAGRVPGYDNLFVIGGLDGYGSMVGPALARRLAEAVARGRDLEGFDIGVDAGEFDPCAERHDWGLAIKKDLA